MEPHLSFHHARLKVEWAKAHIRYLNDICRSFIDEKPYVLTVEPDSDSGNDLFQVGMTQGIPANIALLMGDAVANLRAALDYAWMGLARAHNPSITKLTLPIGDNRKGLISTIEQAPIGPAVEQAKLLLGDRIKSHRDFADGGNRPIIALNELSNWNKHNLLVTAMAVTSIPLIRFGERMVIENMQIKTA